MNQYDKNLSTEYTNEYSSAHPHQYMSYSTWLEEIGDINGKRALDLACGGGTSTRMLSDRGGIMTGVDISEGMLGTAIKKEEENLAGNKYILADASIPKQYDSEAFDMVTAAFMLHYAQNLETLKGFIKNISLNLKSGGKFVSINLSPEHPIVLPGDKISHSSKWLDEPFKDGSKLEVILWSLENKPILTLTDYHWNKKTIEKFLAAEGFTDIKWIELRMHEEGKKIEGWQELQKNNMLVILEARKV